MAKKEDDYVNAEEQEAQSVESEEEENEPEEEEPEEDEPEEEEEEEEPEEDEPEEEKEVEEEQNEEAEEVQIVEGEQHEEAEEVPNVEEEQNEEAEEKQNEEEEDEENDEEQADEEHNKEAEGQEDEEQKGAEEMQEQNKTEGQDARKKVHAKIDDEKEKGKEGNDISFQKEERKSSESKRRREEAYFQKIEDKRKRIEAKKSRHESDSKQSSKPTKEHSSKSRDGHSSKPREGHSSKSREGHSSKPREGHSSKPTTDHSSKSTKEQSLKPTKDHSSKSTKEQSSKDHSSKSTKDHSSKSIKEQSSKDHSSKSTKEQSSKPTKDQGSKSKNEHSSKSANDHRKPTKEKGSEERPTKDDEKSTRKQKKHQSSVEEQVEALCEILEKSSEEELEDKLTISGIRITNYILEEVLKKSYKHGAAASSFFKWAGNELENRYSAFAWNLLVDVLGQNKMFDAMWDTVKSMKNEGMISNYTFASVFTCYAMDGKQGEAMMSFDVMEQYGCVQDIEAFNCLVCALCRWNLTSVAVDFYKTVADKFPPNADTFAILLEGWEKEANVIQAKETFTEMIHKIGWDPFNTAAYNAFLGVLLKGGLDDEFMKVLNALLSKRCHPDGKFFCNAVDYFMQKNKLDYSSDIFGTMLRLDIYPSTSTYNSMISLCCSAGNIDEAITLLDEMVFNGAFPESVTYSTIFKACIRHRKKEAGCILREMIRNEFEPEEDMHIYKQSLIGTDINVALIMWKCMSQRGIFPGMAIIEVFLDNLCENHKRFEAGKCVDDMLDKGVNVSRDILKKFGRGETSKKKKDHS